MGDDLFAEMAQGLILGPQAGTPAGDPFRAPQAYPSQARARAPAPPVPRLSARRPASRTRPAVPAPVHRTCA